jgi:hypothetical protein
MTNICCNKNADEINKDAIKSEMRKNIAVLHFSKNHQYYK